MNRLIRLWMCALALVLLLPGLAAAQATSSNTLPSDIYLPNGNQKVQTVPTYLVSRDTATGLPCLIGTTATCVLAVNATVSASATVANFVPGVPAGLAVNTTSARVAFTGGTTQVLENDGTAALYYLPGNSSVVVTTSTGFLLSPGGKIAIDRGANTHIAAITATGTAHLALSGGTGFVAMSGGGSGAGGGGGDASAANQTAVQAVAGSDASKAVAVQGVTGGKAIPTTISGTLPAFASPPTFNLGTLGGAATSAKQDTLAAAVGDATLPAWSLSGDGTEIAIQKAVALILGATTQTTPCATPTTSGCSLAQLFRGMWNDTSTRNVTLTGTNTVVANSTGATVTSTVTRPANTTAYTANDALSDSTSAPTSGGFPLANACSASGKQSILTGVVVTSTNDPATLLQLELWVFNATVTNLNDNAAFALSDGDANKLVTVIPLTLASTTAGSGTNSYAKSGAFNEVFSCSGGTSAYYLVKVKNAYTPASAEALQARFDFSYLN